MHLSCRTMTLPVSSRLTIALTGHASRQPACAQCLHESLMNSQRPSMRSSLNCSINLTCRQLSADSDPVLSYESPVKCGFSSARSFHSLQATWQALQPVQMDVSTNMPLVIAHLPAACRRGCCP